MSDKVDTKKVIIDTSFSSGFMCKYITVSNNKEVSSKR